MGDFAEWEVSAAAHQHKLMYPQQRRRNIVAFSVTSV
jgi:hypothetical protein